MYEDPEGLEKKLVRVNELNKEDCGRDMRRR